MKTRYAIGVCIVFLGLSVHYASAQRFELEVPNDVSDVFDRALEQAPQAGNEVKVRHPIALPSPIVDRTTFPKGPVIIKGPSAPTMTRRDAEFSYIPPSVGPSMGKSFTADCGPQCQMAYGNSAPNSSCPCQSGTCQSGTCQSGTCRSGACRTGVCSNGQCSGGICRSGICRSGRCSIPKAAFTQRALVPASRAKPVVRQEPVRVGDALVVTLRSKDGPYNERLRATVSAAGDLQLPGVGSVAASGLTVTELKREMEAAYRKAGFVGQATPVIEKRSPRTMQVVGDVARPGVFQFSSNISLADAIELARDKDAPSVDQVILFRRNDDWNWSSTRLNPQRENDAGIKAGDSVQVKANDVILVSAAKIVSVADAVKLLRANGVELRRGSEFTDRLATLER